MIEQNDVFAFLHSITKNMWRIVDRELASLEIGHTEMRILMMLYCYYPDGCRQEELVSQVELDRSNVGRALKKLERLRYLERAINEDDRRAYRVCLTESGWRIRERLFAIRQTMKKAFALNMTDQELDALTGLLRKADQGLTSENYRMLKSKVLL